MAQGRSIASMAITIVGKAGGFYKMVDKVLQRTRRLTRGLREAAVRAAKFGAGLATLGGTAGLAAMVTRSFQTIDALAKLSQRLGETVGNMAALRHAAELTGVAERTLSLGLQRMTRRVAEAAKGMGEARGAIRALGLDAQKLVSVGPAEIFTRVAESMKKIPDQAERVRLAFKLFDSEGVALVQTLDLGRAGLEAARREQEKLRPITESMAKVIVDANDAVTRYKRSLQGLADAIATSLAPTLTKAAEFLTGVAVALRDTNSILRKQIVRYAKLAAAVVGGSIALAGIVKVADLVIKSIRGMAKAWAVFSALTGPKQILVLTAGLAAGAAAGLAIDKVFDSIKGTLGKVSEAGKSFTSEFRKGLDSANRTATEFANTIDQIPQQLQTAVNVSLAKVQSPMQQINEITKGLLDRILAAGLTPEQLELRRIQGLRGQVPEVFVQAAERMHANLQRVVDAVERGVQLKESASRVKDAIKTARQRFDEAMTELREMGRRGLLTAEEIAKRSKQLKTQFGLVREPIEGPGQVIGQFLKASYFRTLLPPLPRAQVTMVRDKDVAEQISGLREDVSQWSKGLVAVVGE